MGAGRVIASWVGTAVMDRSELRAAAGNRGQPQTNCKKKKKPMFLEYCTVPYLTVAYPD